MRPRQEPLLRHNSTDKETGVECRAWGPSVNLRTWHVVSNELPAHAEGPPICSRREHHRFIRGLRSGRAVDLNGLARDLVDRLPTYNYTMRTGLPSADRGSREGAIRCCVRAAKCERAGAPQAGRISYSQQKRILFVEGRPDAGLCLFALGEAGPAFLVVSAWGMSALFVVTRTGKRRQEDRSLPQK